MKVLSIDYGSKRVGLAVGDLSLRIAVPKGTLKNNSRLFEELKRIVRESKVEKIVVGLPLTPSGKEGQRAREVRAFVERLSRELPHIDIVLWDERYTTQEAHRRLRGKKFEKEHIDALSAQIILEEFLESL